MQVPTLLAQLGFKPNDISFLFACGLFSAAGTVVHVIISYWDLEALPEEGTSRSPIALALQKVGWILGSLTVGFLLGVFLALYLVGSLPESVPAVARMLALAMLFGYGAPHVLKRGRSLLDRGLTSVLEDKGSQDSPDRPAA